MAIPYYVPEEYGPPPPAPVNPNVDRNNNNTNNGNNHQQQVYHENQYPSIGQVIRYNQSQREISFVQQLVMEILRVYDHYTAEREVNQNQAASSSRRYRPYPQRRQQEDNQGFRGGNAGMYGASASASVSSPPLSPMRGLPLPDIIQCHSEVAFNFCTTSTTSSASTNTSYEDFRFHESRLGNPAEDVVDGVNVEEDWSFGVNVKLEVAAYRRVGRDLRRIADNFEPEMRQPYTRRRRRSFDIGVVMKMAVPAIALVGMGIAFFRRQ